MSKQVAIPETPTPGDSQPSTFAAVFPFYIVAFTVQLGMGIVGPILPDLSREFTLSAWQAGLVVTMFGVARLIADIPLGYVLGRVSAATVLVAGTLLIVAGSIASAISQEYILLLAARFVMGTGSAMCTVTALFSLSRTIGSGSRGKAIGAFQSSIMAGNAFSPAIGGAVAALLDWRASFLFCSFTGALALAMALLMSSKGQLKFANSQPPHGHHTGSPTDRAERRIPWNVMVIDLVTFILFFNMSGFRNTMVPLHGGTMLGLGAGTLGLMLGASALIRFCVTLVSGFLSDRYGRKVILIPGNLILTLGTGGFLFAGDTTSFILWLGIHSLGGFGNAIPTTMIVDTVPQDRVGMAISVNRFLGDAGMLTGPVLLGLLLDTFGFTAVVVVSVVVLLATIPALALVPERRGSR